MAYLGTPPRSRVLSSADIDPGSVSLDDISFTDQPASMNISGNIDKHTMRLSDQVVVNGDLDITDNLILSKISDDGNAITLTTDGSTRTIEGAGGSLEASTLTQTPNSSLTGMTGEIGSAVTFPAGSVIGVVQDIYTTIADTSSGYATAAESSTYTIKQAGSTIYVDGHFQYRTTDANSKIKVIWSNDGFSSNETQVSLSSSFALRSNSDDIMDDLVPFHEKFSHGGAVGSTVKVRVQINKNGGSGSPEANGNDSARIRLMEVAG